MKQVVVEAKEEANIPQEEEVEQVKMVEEAHLKQVEKENNPITLRIIQLQEVEDMEEVGEEILLKIEEVCNVIIVINWSSCKKLYTKTSTKRWKRNELS